MPVTYIKGTFITPLTPEEEARGRANIPKITLHISPFRREPPELLWREVRNNGLWYHDGVWGGILDSQRRVAHDYPHGR